MVAQAVSSADTDQAPTAGQGQARCQTLQTMASAAPVGLPPAGEINLERVTIEAQSGREERVHCVIKASTSERGFV